MSAAPDSLDAIEVPTDDSDIANALSTLDARIQAWTEAMRQLQRVLQVQARSMPSEADHPADQPNEGAAPESKSAPPVSGEPPADDVPVKVTREMLEPGSGPDTPTDPNARKSKDDQQDKGLKARLKRMVSADDASADREGDIADGKAADQPGTTTDAGETPPDQGEDDEALLASLSTEMANAIRIKRRLSHGRKSVRQLLDGMS